MADSISQSRVETGAETRFSRMATSDLISSMVVLFAFAIAQPLLDLLGANPEFFVAHNMSRGMTALLAVLIVAAVPVMLGGLIALLVDKTPRVGEAAFVVASIGLSAVFWLKVVEGLGVDSALLAVTFACAMGIITTAIYLTVPVVRSAGRVLAIVTPVAVVAMFAMISPASALLLPSQQEEGRGTTSVGNPVPIVMIVLDELPVASLIDDQGTLQTDLYPNIGRLADDGVWFRNAVTLESNTTRAIPSILTGSLAHQDSLPIAAHYPDNLFTILEGFYDVWASESVTDLCSGCDENRSARPDLPWRTIVNDLIIVNLHLTLPNDWTATLPPIDETWGGFAIESEAGKTTATSSEFDLKERFDSLLGGGRVLEFEQFVSGLEDAADSRDPTFTFLHLMLPHSPWAYLPDGRRHGAPVPPAGKVGKGWGDNEWLVVQAYQQHLLQVQFVDHLVGRAIDRLQALDMYDDSIIVLLADHGIVMRPNVERRRGVTPESLGEIVQIPLIMKFPGAIPKGIDDYRAELTDVVPTIIDIIDAEVDLSFSGTSLLSDNRPNRTSSALNAGMIEYGVSGREKLAVAARKLRIFPDGDPFKLAPQGYSNLLGIRQTELITGGVAPFAATIPDLARYRSVDLDGEAIPAHISGTLSLDDDTPVTLAIGINGIIGAVTQSYRFEGTTYFQAMLPPDYLETSNIVDIFLVEEGSAGREVSAIPVNG